jgi:hypothetical protein
MTKATIARHTARRNQLEGELRRLQFSEVIVTPHGIAKAEEVKSEIFKENCWLQRNNPNSYPRFRAFLEAQNK